MEENKDLYATIIEETRDSKKIISYGNKLTRYAEPKYNDAFSATAMTDHSSQIVTRFTHSEKHERKMEIKIGRITDNTILQKIKNEDATGFSDLLSYAKKTSGEFDKTIPINAIFIQTSTSEGGPLINLNRRHSRCILFLIC